MTGLPAELSHGLSDRALAYAGIVFESVGPSPDDSMGLIEQEPDDDFAMARRAAIAFDSAYRGLSVVSLGGPLVGEIRLGVNGQRPIWNAGAGLTVFRCGRHANIQCAIVSTLDGRVGCSWSREFTPLFDSLGVFLENAAAWGYVQGWRYVAIGDLSTESVVEVLHDVDAVAQASGVTSGWWIGDDVAVASQQYLNPSRNGRPQVSVLAKTPSSEREVRRRIENAGIPPLAYRTAEVMGLVPMLSV